MQWDEAKSRRNRTLRGFGFEIAEEFDWDHAVVAEDTRQDYGEPRYRAFGRAGNLKLAIAFTLRDGEIRAISAGRMHIKEAQRYGIV